MPKVYADYNSTTPLCDDVLKHMAEYGQLVGNMESAHFFGQKMHQLYDETVESIQSILMAHSFDVFTCSSATEANNWFFHSLLSEILDCPRVITSAIEHSCILEPLHHYSDLGAIDLQICNVTQDGFIDLDHYQSLLNSNTKLVSIGLANNELGTIQPISEITRMAKKVGAITHSDIVQAVGKLPLELDQLMLDAVSISAHKCYAPTGCGILMVNDSNLIKPLFYGGSQQQRLRPGTVNVFGLSMFEKGLNYCYRNMNNHLNIADWVQDFRNHSSKFNVLAGPDLPNSLWNTVNLSVLGKNAYDVMMALDMHDFAVSTGSACSTGAVDPSDSILALGLPSVVTDGAIRISFGYPSTTEELQLLKALLFKLFG